MNEEELKLLNKLDDLPNKLNLEIRGLILAEVMFRKENQKYKEVINELRNYLEARIEICVNRLSTPFCDFENTIKERLVLSQCLEKLEELEVEHE